MINIVVISVAFNNARKICNLIENMTFDSSINLRDYLTNHLEIDEESENQPQFFSLNDFMEECNDQFINLETVFISYVNIIK